MYGSFFSNIMIFISEGILKNSYWRRGCESVDEKSLS